ncbi:homoserine O-acetyltransferase MetX [Microbacterium sp.]|uniref:homoserine O-acetyltransferase MetX n=1 Tax=Microbacterium sp. TaxID=51671 RepID=UPI0039E3C9DC
MRTQTRIEDEPAAGSACGTGATRRTVDIGDLELESGVVLPGVRIAFELFGDLDATRGNAVLVFHGLAADSHLVRSAEDPRPGWWEGVVGEGLGLDTRRWCVVSAAILGGCGGSTGPLSLAPDGAPWAGRFPAVTIRDQVRAVLEAGRALGITRWAAVVGASFGAMHALEWHVSHPGTAARTAVIAGPWQTTAEQIVQNSLQVEIVRADPHFHGGFYAGYGTAPTRGLALARTLGMLSYRGSDEMETRFGRAPQEGTDGTFAVESYFAANATKFAERFDANSFIALVTAKNTHDIGRGRGPAADVLRAADGPLLVLGIRTDRLFPLDQQRFVAAHSPGSVTGSVPAILDAPHGHDSFLIAQDLVGAQLSSFLGAGESAQGKR